MAEITIVSRTYGTHIAFVDDEDMPKLKGIGMYIWTSKRHHTFYLMATINKKQIRVHRLLLGVTDPKKLVDHKNGNGLDNRRDNLRVTDSRGNNSNARKRKNARTSKYKGVHLDSGSMKWIAQIQVNSKKLSLGHYLVEEEAAKAYNQAALKYFGEFAVLNEVGAK